MSFSLAPTVRRTAKDSTRKSITGGSLEPGRFPSDAKIRTWVEYKLIRTTNNKFRSSNTMSQLIASRTSILKMVRVHLRWLAEPGGHEEHTSHDLTASGRFYPIFHPKQSHQGFGQPVQEPTSATNQGGRVGSRPTISAHANDSQKRAVLLSPPGLAWVEHDSASLIQGRIKKIKTKPIVPKGADTKFPPSPYFGVDSLTAVHPWPKINAMPGLIPPVS